MLNAPTRAAHHILCVLFGLVLCRSRVSQLSHQLVVCVPPQRVAGGPSHWLAACGSARVIYTRTHAPNTHTHLCGYALAIGNIMRNARGARRYSAGFSRTLRTRTHRDRDPCARIIAGLKRTAQVCVCVCVHSTITGLTHWRKCARMHMQINIVWRLRGDTKSPQPASSPGGRRGEVKR